MHWRWPGERMLLETFCQLENIGLRYTTDCISLHQNGSGSPAQNCLTAGSGTGPPRRHRVLNRALPQIVGWCKVNCYVCLGGPSILKRHGKRGNCDASVQRPPALSRAPLLRFDDPAQRAAHSPSRTFRQRVHQSAQMASRHAFSKEAKLCPGTAVAVGRPWSVFRAGHAAAS